ncbi:hypothetical protein [Novosphingobium album (ex Liu et al. 2023)]|uniref:Secreted protein n=1 Tax=Novosphingobium album (ex Liu et al. 2023) TaxID=3031130 RepID=A0ABT5WN91_9SPHN|nr:hypothetical protein [Novosphingobium album (ex Liu et al. 2023)]MDE8651513.1 hypothetical protein [Novosphingobium album (ex Liu et al. 2023)]
MASVSRIIAAVLLTYAGLSLGACGGGDGAGPTPTPTPGPSPTPSPGAPAADCPQPFANGGVIAGKRNCVLPNRILQNLTLPRRDGTIYSLSGRVEVGRDVGSDAREPGGVPVTLTVDPGVVVFGSGGLDYLVVNRGSKLRAAGTATAPIIFTSRANVEGLATDSSQGQWGGIIVLGRAPISDCLGGAPGGSDTCEQAYEGLSDIRYGGGVANDDSGTLQYLQIRYAGFELAPDQEINGLTLAGVGSATVIDHIQVHNSADDAIEWFGGRANAKYLVLTGADDDSLDTDQGYQGFIQFVIAVQRAGGASGDTIVEADSPGNEDSLPRQWTRLANFTFIERSTGAASAMLIRGGADYTMANGVVVSPGTCVNIASTRGTTFRAADAALADQGPPVFRSVALSCGEGNFPRTSEITAAIWSGIFDFPASNNHANFTPTLTGLFVNGANENAVPAFDASTLGGFMARTDHIGAVKDGADTWYRGWTCDSATAGFGSGASCLSLPQ